MKTSSCKLGFIGFGHMAQVIYQAIDHAKLLPHANVQFLQRDPGKMKQNEQKYRITSTSLKHMVETSDFLLLAVRPNQAQLILSELAKLSHKKPLISILAGVKIGFFQKILGADTPILRVMPNLASAVGEGMSVLTPSANFSAEARSFSHLLFGCMGQILEVPESLTDIACGIAGSGPGFVFRLIEAMAKAGEKEGMTYDQSLKMAAQVFLGASRLILKGASPETLMQQITVPNGTTAAGFDVMRQTEMDRHLKETVWAAARRSKELSEEIR